MMDYIIFGHYSSFVARFTRLLDLFTLREKKEEGLGCLSCSTIAYCPQEMKPMLASYLRMRATTVVMPP